MLKPLNSMHTL